MVIESMETIQNDGHRTIDAFVSFTFLRGGGGGGGGGRRGRRR